MSVTSSLTGRIDSKKAPSTGWNLLSFRPLRWFMASPFYPSVFLLASLVIFSLVVYTGLFGTVRPAYNFATTLTWNIWWPLLPISLLLLGRVWCAICPIVPVMSLVQWISRPRALPGRFLKRYGIWLMGSGFVFLTLADRLWRITSSPKATAILLLFLALVGAILAAVYTGRAFCRFVCPIGALTGLYAMTSVVGLRSRGLANCQGCAKECFRGSHAHAGCPLYQYVKTMDSNRNCNLCAECLKSCPQDSVKLELGVPGKDLWRLRSPIVGEALLVILLVGMVFMQTIDMSQGWGSYMRWLLQSLPISSYNLGLVVTFAGVLALVAVAYLVVSRWSSGTERWPLNFALYGYAYIPLALAVHLGHNSVHLVSEGPNALRVAARTLANPFTAAVTGSTTGAVGSLSMLYMLPLVMVGGVASGYVAWRISQRSESGSLRSRLLPHLLFLAVLTVVFVLTFLLPMNPRHAH